MDTRLLPDGDYLGAVTKTAQYLTGLRSGQQVWVEFAQVLRYFFHADVVAFLMGPPTGTLRFRYCSLTSREAREQLLAQAGEAARQALARGFLAAEIVSLPEPHAIALFPLVSATHPETVLLVGHATDRPLPAPLLDVYLAVTGLFESTLARLHFEEQLGIRAMRQARVAELGQEALRGDELLGLMGRTAARATETLAVDCCGFFQPVEEGKLKLCAGYGWKEGRVGSALVDPGTGSQEGFALLSKAPVVAEDLLKEAQFALSPLVQEQGARSGMSVPLQGKERDFGVMSVYSATPRLFTEEELNFLQGFANIICAAAERKAEENRVRRLNTSLEERVAARTADLEQAYNELEEFLYSLSHDLRIPVRAVEGFSQILLTEHRAQLDEEGSRLLATVVENARRIARLIDDILAFSRIGRMDLAAEPVDMKGLAAEVWSEVEATLGERRIQFTVSEMPPAHGTVALLREVWQQLLHNAAKFTRTREAAVIEVSGSRVDDEGIYRVKDNGVGFDMQYADKLFGVFRRLHGVEEFEGTGIGLAIVKRIVQRHGGRVWAEGKPDAGAVFYFALPLPPAD